MMNQWRQWCRLPDKPTWPRSREQRFDPVVSTKIKLVLKSTVPSASLKIGPNIPNMFEVPAMSFSTRKV